MSKTKVQDGTHTFHIFGIGNFRLATITFKNYGANHANQQALKVCEAIDGAVSICRAEDWEEVVRKPEQ